MERGFGESAVPPTFGERPWERGVTIHDYAAVLIFAALGLLFMVGGLAAGWLLRPSRPTKVKRTTYECGERPIGEAQVQFRVIFYLFGLLFLIFDVEAAYIIPWAAVLRSLAREGYGLFALVEMYAFIGILLVGLLYAWRKGVLRWG